MRNKILCTCTGICITLVLFNSNLQAQDSELQDEKAKSVSEQLKEIKQSHREMVSELTLFYRESESNAMKQAIVKKRRAAELDLTRQAIQLAEDNDNVAENVETLGWLTRYSKGLAREEAIDHLLENYLESDEIETWIQHLDRFNTPAQITEDSLRKLMKESPHKNVRGKAALTLGRYFLRLANTTPEIRENLKSKLGRYLEKWDVPAAEAEMERVMTICVEQYSEIPYQRRSTVGDMAKLALAQVQLRVGKIAPEIEGEDIDGVNFKLSDYRGKVVVIDFWGDW